MSKAMEKPSAPSALRSRLKHHTAATHEALQASPLVRRLLEPNLTWPEYRDLLGRYYGFLEPLAERLRDHADGSPWMAFVEPALRLDELRRDLQTAAVAPDALPKADARWLQPEPSVTVGVIYVLLGSTLGGKLIARSLAQSLRLTPVSGCAYFAGVAADQAGSWRCFLDQLEQQPWSTTDQEQIQTAALHTFQHLQRRLDRRAITRDRR
jgi:heme oxygenase